jgi:hypothetical protein
MSHEKMHSPYRYLFWGLVFAVGGGLWRASLMGYFEWTWNIALPAMAIVFGLGLLIAGLLRRGRSA